MSVAPLGAGDTVLCTATMNFGSLRAFIAAAGKTGFSAISMCGGDYKQAKANGFSDADIRGLLADHDLRVAEFDGVIDWLNPLPTSQGAGYDLNIPFFGHTEAEFFAMAAAMGARSLTAVDPFEGSAPLERMVEAFAGLCDRAAEHGLLVHLEFLSWGAVPDLATAWDIVRMADRANGGLVLDTLHLIRSGSRDMLAEIPADRIFATQFCDGMLQRSSDRFTDAANRLWPCEGQFELPSILRDLQARGCTAPLGVEVMNEDTRAMPASEIAERASAALTALKRDAQLS